MNHALRLAAAALAAMAIFPGAVRAQVPAAIAECAAIASDAERLACYDRASGRGPAAVPAPAPAKLPEPPSAVGDTGAQAAAGALRAPASLIDAAWGFEPGSSRYAIDLYNQNYLLFARYTNDLNTAPYVPLFQAAGKPVNLDDVEAKFQLSFKFRLWTTDDRRWGVWAAYTQQNQWQVYNGDTSRPFRETNYMPELFVSYRPGLDLGGGFQWNLLNVGYNHQSNGRTDILSRSWDRIVATFGIERGDFALLAKVWYPFNYKEDNPDITDYYGYGSLTAIYKWRGHSFSLMGRGNLSKGKGAAELTWMSPRLLGPLRAYVQAFSGYGESMIDYNWNQTTIGAGVSLNDAL
ncbi:MAG: phospholipase A [Burkholderiales bacterium]|nr:phospholipase A [Burkholderiales bacterium]